VLELFISGVLLLRRISLKADNPPKPWRGRVFYGDTMGLPVGLHEWDLMKKLKPGDEIVKVDEQLGIAWILLPPDPNLEGFQGISPRIKDEEKFIGSKRKSEKE
jgi:hypothetical protein